MRQRTEKTDYNNNMEKTDNEMEQIQKGLEHFLESEVDGMELREGPEEEVEPEEEEIEPGEEREGEMKKEKRDREEQEDRRKRGGGRTKRSGLKKFLVFLAVVIALFFAGLYIAVGAVYDRMNSVQEGSMKGPLKKDGVTSMLLIGSDSRTAGTEGRSDAMILITISDRTKTVHMTSLLRDMYVDIPGHDGNRLNAAYAYGGPELLMETVNQNFGTEVYHYAVVNFEAFAGLVDAVGGVELELTAEEVQWVNAYLNEYNELRGMPMETDYLDTSLSGNIHLNGAQALAYCRNRYIGTDFARTQRQRNVLSAVMKKLPSALLTNPGGLVNGLFPNLTTNLTRGECMRLMLMAGKLLSYDLVQDSLPLDGTYSNATIREMAVLQVDFEQNRAYIRKEIYGEE
ncbi:MAG TPA: LCP family protein [Candidatus Eisenbergiella stercorigallinarum]|uniref:LCP family protein n=1 Tax=Candidatus Eisenbergiella stercorigallinarum TaxID=2838557 RepID=A0A9D2QZ96_9FIRM|nr:LCP family protein [Candidatus Eisenbergiella stercorigallinarum]